MLDCHYIGRKTAGTFASLLDDRVKEVALKNSLKSYSHIDQNEYYEWALSALLLGVLANFDFTGLLSRSAKYSLHR